jgi:transposase
MNSTTFSITIGVDIAKKKFDVAGLLNNKPKHAKFTNDSTGFAEFVDWFAHLYGDAKPLICMESTGAYSLPLADFLVNQGHAVSLVNPAKIHAFAKSELCRAKTDKADAKLIARYALTMQPPLWIPPPAAIRELQALVRRVEHLLEMIQMEKNRSGTAHGSVQPSISNVLTTLEAELKATREAIQNRINNDPDLKKRGELLDSIPGVGEATVAHLLIALSPHHEFSKAKQVVAFAGLAPAPRESGQWRGNTHIAKNGDAVLRKALYMPAIVAWGCNPLIKPFCERLKANGKNGKAIVCAAMRKLIHIAFGILKSGKRFDPKYVG